ncbi:MAG: glucokinase [Acidobacteriota bacterium]|nr:glucokinase [Acidobacteriota bacterium]
MSELLAGDVGGTRVRLAVARTGPRGLALSDRAEFDAAAQDGLDPIVASYLAELAIRPVAAAFGVPGPIVGTVVCTTTRSWVVDRSRLETLVGAPVALVNDLAATASGVPTIEVDRLDTLQTGDEEAEGPLRTRAVVAPGTGLGEAGLVSVDGRWLALPSEGGHAEFAPRDEEESEILAFLRSRFSHVSYERVVSGPGLANLHTFYAGRARVEAVHWPDREDAAAAVTAGAGAGDCPACVAAVDRFASVLGAEAGNLALKLMATGGVYLAGGILPKMVPALWRGPLLEGFRDKGRYAGLMARIPVHVVRDEDLALRGAALEAARLVA